MATGDHAGRNAVALVQSLRDSETQAPHIIVLLSKGGVGSADCRARKAACRHSSVPSNIISQKYIDAIERLGGEVRVVDAMPETEFTKKIAGGRAIFWGMAFNKLRVFELTEFRKVIYLDSDVLVQHNIDHLFLEPEFTGGFTTDCCNRNAPTKLSGGLWVFTPSEAHFQRILNATQYDLPDGADWRLGDMEVMMSIFGDIDPHNRGRRWPLSRDSRQGRVPKLELVDERWAQGHRDRFSAPTGLHPDKEREARKQGKPVWNMLDVRYDGLVGDCYCQATKDLGLSRSSAVEIGLLRGIPGSRFHSDTGTVADLPVIAPRLVLDNTAKSVQRTPDNWGLPPRGRHPRPPGALDGTNYPVNADPQSPHWRPDVRIGGFSEGFITLHFSCLPVGFPKPCKFEKENRFLEELRTQPPCLRQYAMLWYSKYKRAMGGVGFDNPVGQSDWLDMVGPPYAPLIRQKAKK